MPARLLFLSAFILGTVLSQAQLPEFSNLSSRTISRRLQFNSLRVDDGILYFAPRADNIPVLYKVDFNGAIVDSVYLVQDDYRITGILASNGDKILMAGEANKPFVSYDQLFNDRRAALVILNSELEILDINLYDIVPYSAGWTRSITSGSPISTFIQPAGGIGIVNDTVYITKQYTYFDTLTFLPNGFDRVIERMMIQGPALATISIAASTLDVYASVFTDNAIYVNGQSGEPSGSLILDPAAVGEYDYAGNFIQKHLLLDVPSLGFDPTFESVGNRAGNRIYNSVVDEGFFGAPCASAMLDIRNLDFQQLRLVKVPDCGMAPSGTKCVSISDNAIYYLTRDGDFNLGLYKYDTTLNLIWRKIYDFSEPHYGIAINAMPDGGVILECVIDDADQGIIKLYKVSALGDIISSTKLVADPKIPLSVYPNPFSAQLFIQGEIAQKAIVKIYDLAGNLLFSEPLAGQMIDCTELPAGAYSLCLFSQKNGALLHSQCIMKGGR